MAPELRIVNPVERNFSCNNCGYCCTTPWKVKVAPERIPVIESTERYQQLKRDGYDPLPVIDGEAETGRRDDGSCFYRHQDGCAIHREKGGPAKPIVCQMFPYSLINSPDGYYLSLSFACPSVVQGTGDPVSEQVAALQEAVSASSYFQSAPMNPDSHVPITHNRAMSWKQYIAMEQDLLNFMGENHPVKDGLKAALLLAQHASSPAELDWRAATNEDAIEQATRLFPFYAAYTIATLENEDAPEKVDDFCARLMQCQRLPSNLLEPTELPILKTLQPSPHAISEVVRRYVENFILGKQLISVAPMVTRLLVLSVAVQVVFFYLEARTEGSSGHDADEDILWCFRLAETCIFESSDVLAPLFAHFGREILAVSTARSPL
jgi:Fe-S-cluster containining protein